MLTPGRRFHQRPSAMAAVLVVLAAVLAIPTALVLTARATAEDRAVADVLAKYEAARKTVPGRYLMLVRSERELCVTWQDGTRFYFARYLFGGPSRAGREDYHPDDLMGVVAEARASAGETIASMLAWANRQIPERVDMGDETRGCGFTSDGFGHLREDKYRFPRLDLPGTSSPILQGLGWPEIASSGRACRLVSDDRYAVDNNLICVERTLQVTNTSSGVKTPAASRLPEPCQGLHLPAEA